MIFKFQSMFICVAFLCTVTFQNGKLKRGEYAICYSKDGRFTFVMWKDANQVAVFSSIPALMDGVCIVDMQKF